MNTELITIAVKVEWVGAEVEEMNRRLVGDVKRAEIVEKTKMRLMNKLTSTLGRRAPVESDNHLPSG